MAAFAITTASSSVTLDAGGTAQVPFTVTNTSGQRLHARARVVPEAPAQAQWFTVAGAEQDAPAGATLQFTVQVSVPRETPTSSSRFRLDVIGVENPDELFGQGPSISLEVRAVAQPRPVPWLWIIVAAAAVVLAGVTALAWVLTHRPGVQVQAVKQDFGTVTIGQAGTLPVTVRNSGGSQTTMSVAIQGDTAEFDLAKNGCAGVNLQAGGACPLIVRFHPSTIGARTATLTVVTAGSGARQSLSLRGTATGVGQLTFNPTQLQLHAPGGAPVTVPVVVTDTGTAPVVIRGLRIVPVAQGLGNFFIPANSCAAGTTLKPGASCQVTVAFQSPVLFFPGPPTIAQLTVDSDLPAPVFIQLVGFNL